MALRERRMKVTNEDLKKLKEMFYIERMRDCIFKTIH
jgi:hypothetical protein